jgi:hypothetical protein
MISVLINTIKVNQGRREVNVKKVSELADSIKQIGFIYIYQNLYIPNKGG